MDWPSEDYSQVYADTFSSDTGVYGLGGENRDRNWPRDCGRNWPRGRDCGDDRGARRNWPRGPRRNWPRGDDRNWPRGNNTTPRAGSCERALAITPSRGCTCDWGSPKEHFAAGRPTMERTAALTLQYIKVFLLVVIVILLAMTLAAASQVLQSLKGHLSTLHQNDLGASLRS